MAFLGVATRAGGGCPFKALGSGFSGWREVSQPREGEGFVWEARCPPQIRRWGWGTFSSCTLFGFASLSLHLSLCLCVCAARACVCVSFYLAVWRTG